MRNFLFTLLSCAGACLGASAQTTPRSLYVSSGVDINGTANGIPPGTDDTAAGRGTTPGNAFRTIQYAASKSNPGDVIFIRKGTYRNNGQIPLLKLSTDIDTNTGQSTSGIQLARSGTATVTPPGQTTAVSGQITYRNYPDDGERPLLKFNSNNCILIDGTVAYISFFGLRIQGNNSEFDPQPSPGNPNPTYDGANPAPGVQVNLSEAGRARFQAGGCEDPAPVGTAPNKYNGNGISTNGGTHHLRIIDNEVFECGGAGIGIGAADYVTIERNSVHDNSWYTVYGTSGITVNGSQNFIANDPNTAYRFVINRNTVYNNRLYVPWYKKEDPNNPCRGFTDGNGIIIDVNNPTATTGYTGKTLIANNLVFNNGASGIQALKSNKVDIVHNTLYRNLRSADLINRGTNGEININQSNTVTVQSNIVSTNSIYNSSGTLLATRAFTGSPTFATNLFYNPNGDGGFAPPAGTLTGNPQFINPTTDISAANFRLRATATSANPPGSPAINVGASLSQIFINATSAAANSPLDRDGGPRVFGSKPDLGAYEAQTAVNRAALASTTSDSPTSTGAQLEAYPNPFSGSATLSYFLDRPGPVRLEVVDLLGRRVALLVNDTQPAGRHEARFEAPGRAAALYQVRLTTAAGSTAQKLASQP